MGKGYRIVEPDQLDPLIRDTNYHEFAVLIYKWLISELHKELKDNLEGVEIEIIPINFLGGERPALGVHYENVAFIDTHIDKLIEVTCDQLLQERPISEFLAFIAN